jgi:fructoselysine 3-epimerase
MMNIGCVTSVFVNYPIQEAIQRIGKAGYDGVDIWGGRPHIYRQDFSINELKSIRSLAEQLQLKINSFLPAFYRYPHNLCSPNDIIRQDTLTYVYQCADNAVLLGADYLLVCPAKIIYGQTIEDGWSRMVDSLQNICEYVAQYAGMKVMLEPVNRQAFDLINTASDAVHMIEQVDYPDLGIILDSGHMHLEEGSVKEAIQIAGNRLFQVHINDNDGQHQQNLIPGEGTFNFQSFIAQLDEAGFDGFLSAELGGLYTSNPDPAIKQTVDRLKEMLPAA